MATNEQVIVAFYEAFQRKDYTRMQGLYHEEATFSDPVFRNLNCREVRSMWEMLITASSDLAIQFHDVSAKGNAGSCRWEAWYTFTKTGRPVHNVIDASFEFKDGLIFRHRDSFDLWRWSRMALGPSGVFLGWSSFIHNKIRTTARDRLNHFIKKSA